MAEENNKSSSGMPQSDVDFLIACLKNTNGGSISINSQAVASALGYNNPRSVSNRMTLLRKKYDLPFGSTGAGGGAKSKDSSAPSTPTKNAGVKKKATPKKTAAAKSKSKVKDEEENANDDMEDAETIIDEDFEDDENA